MRPGLPPPVTYEQVYLAAILDELRAIRALMAADGPPEASAYLATNIVELKEQQIRRKRTRPNNGEAK